MKLPVEIIKRMAECVIDTFTEADLEQFTSVRTNVLIATYKDATSSDLNKLQRTPQYLKWLNNRGLAIKFFKFCINEHPGFKEHLKVKQLEPDLRHIVVDDDGNVRFAENLFQFVLMRNNKFPFIDRKKLRTKMYDLIHGGKGWCLCINGAEKTGKSYTKFFFLEVGEKTKEFQTVIIDFDKNFRNVGGQVDMHDLAKHLVKTITKFKFEFDLESQEHFKYDIFWKALTEFLAESEVPYLFFFDHFDRPLTGAVTDFIDELVDGLLYSSDRNYYLVLSGYDGAREWDWEYQQFTDDFKVEHFEKEEVEEFVAHLYKAIAEENEIAIPEDVWMSFCKQNASFFKDELYKPQVPNTQDVAIEVMKWIENILSKAQNN